ncbi:MAG: acyl-CoA thioesterase II [Acidobacteriota bacterium]
MNYSATDLLALLELEQIEENLFRAVNGPGTHVFGGQVLSQAIVAAARTVDADRQVHSIHAYFLRRGDWRRPILFEVDRIRDGKSFTTRRVVGIQHGRAIFNLSASFQVSEGGLSHQAPMPDVPGPEGLPTDEDHYTALAEKDPSIKRFAFRYQILDSRQVEGIHMFPRGASEARPPRKSTWMRMKASLPDDPILHRALLSYMSDMDFMSTTMLPHSPVFVSQTIQGASLDHAMWFHRPFRVDEWLLFVKESPNAAGARGYVRGNFYSESGDLVASAVQECLIRLREPEQGVIP